MAEPAKVHEFWSRRRVEFADTDLSGLVHFARYLVFMETAEHEFLESLGTPVHHWRGEQEIGWPRVAAECSYLAPVRFGDQLDIRLRVARKGRKSMTYVFDFLNGERKVARGRITAVCCVVNDPEGLKAVPIPPGIADRVEESPDE
ncbi:MAG: thioesterase family protein [Thermoanaerobaculia bacterium]|nr:thioesterase family protein [Thermoanaerobaculia bacterium]